MTNDHDPITDDQVLRNETNRHQLQQIISGLSDGVILVEPDQSILWANASALIMHGVADVAALGKDVTEYRQRFQLRYRNNHKIEAGHYPIDRVIAGEVFDDVIVEVVAASDDDARWVHRVRSLVLTDAKGNPDCLVLIVADLTAWASAEQRFERAFNANPAPALICRLSDQRYVKINQGFIDMTGYQREQVLGRTVYEFDVFDKADKRDLAIERLGDGLTIPQMEATLRAPDGGTKLVVVAGQPIEMGDENCMLFTFMDLEPRRIAEDSLRQSEARFAKAFRMSPVPTAVCTLHDFRVVEANEAFVSTSGYTLDELTGKSPEELDLFAERGLTKDLRETLSRGENVEKLEVRVATKLGRELTCLISAEAIDIHGKPSLLMVITDITERKNTELELAVAIEAVMQDASWFSQTLIEKLANARHGKSAGADRAALSDLTTRERDVLGLVCEGLPDKEIADRLALSVNTVRNHVSAFYAKLEVHSRSEAMLWARARGFFGSPARADAVKKSELKSGLKPRPRTR